MDDTTGDALRYCPDHDEPMERWVRLDGSTWWVCDHCGAWRDEDVTPITTGGR